MNLTKRAKRTESSAASFRRWRDVESDLHLVEVKSKLGLPSRWLVVRQLNNGNEMVVSRHRKRSGAMRQLITMERREGKR